jgi:arginase
MSGHLVIVGAPSSAGAYAPGQEKAPQALRAAGLLDRFAEHGIDIEDWGDVPGFRWRVDRVNPRAMNANTAAQVAKAVAKRVASALSEEKAVLVLGGDCTVELGTVAGAIRGSHSVGLVYIDLDTDLNTPESTEDGALDWMGVAHLLDIPNTVPVLAEVGTRKPLLESDQILFFANNNSKPFEREIIAKRGLAEVKLEAVAADPESAAVAIKDDWARRFERLLIHLDVDVLDYLDLPLAENTRRNVGLRFDQLIAALSPLLSAPNWTALTISELNPDHGEIDGSTLRTFIDALADALAAVPRLQAGAR